MVDVMTIDLHRDTCDRWQFYAGWIQDKELAVWQPCNKWNATARNRYNYISRQGYVVKYGFKAYNENLEDIYAINTSAKERQGRGMNPAYFDYPKEKNVINTCYHHAYYFIGIVYQGTMKAYAILHVMGELMNISTIIGHADYLKEGIMLALTAEIQEFAAERPIKAVTYGTWDSGTDGLRYFKHSTGFQPLTLSE
jgi:hypothetical protein